MCVSVVNVYNSTLNVLWADMAPGQPLQKLQNPSTPMRHEGIFLWHSQEHQEKVILCRCMYKNHSLNETVTSNPRSTQTIFCQLICLSQTELSSPENTSFVGTPQGYDHRRKCYIWWGRVVGRVTSTKSSFPSHTSWGELVLRFPPTTTI